MKKFLSRILGINWWIERREHKKRVKELQKEKERLDKLYKDVEYFVGCYMTLADYSYGHKEYKHSRKSAPLEDSKEPDVSELKNNYIFVVDQSEPTNWIPIPAREKAKKIDVHCEQCGIEDKVYREYMWYRNDKLIYICNKCSMRGSSNL